MTMTKMDLTNLEKIHHQAVVEVVVQRTLKMLMMEHKVAKMTMTMLTKMEIQWLSEYQTLDHGPANVNNKLRPKSRKGK